MEKIVRAAITTYFSVNNIISVYQHGFVKKKSCSTNLLETTDYLSAMLEARKSVDILFLDFAKAFDTVPHRRLIQKLKAYGITGNLLNWIKAFLSNRKQRVCLGDNSSDWANVLSGVPQGSVLGPILFVIYINDLPNICENQAKMYADDTKILADVTLSNGASTLQNDINNVVNWSKEWLIKLNSEKCFVMHFGKQNSKVKYFLENREIQTTVLEKDLGIWLSSDLKWKVQCEKASQKANNMLGILKRTFINRNPLLWKNLYTTYIRPNMEYAITVWNPSCKKDIQTLEKIQRRSTRVAHCLKDLNYEERCAHLNLQKLTERRIRGDMIQKFKFINCIDKINWHVQPRTLERNGRKKFIREINKSCQQRFHFFNNRTVNSWNSLPRNVIKAESVNQFKELYDRNNCYSVLSK
jgi:hypothetical protein